LAVAAEIRKYMPLRGLSQRKLAGEKPPDLPNDARFTIMSIDWTRSRKT
jgi:hypothetical protein